MAKSLPSSAAFLPHAQLPGERLYRAAFPLSFSTDVLLLIEKIRVNSTEPLHVIPALKHHLLGIVLDGKAEGKYRIESGAKTQKASVSMGTTFLIEAHSDGHWGWATESCTVMLVYVPPTLLHRVCAAHGVPQDTFRTQFLGHDLFQYFWARSLELVLEDLSNFPSGDALARSISQTLVLRVAAQQQTTPALLNGSTGPLSAPLRRRLKDYIQARLDEDIQVSDLAAHADMSASHFSRLFKETVGMTPYRYVLYERVRQAQDLLASTDDSIAGIALQVGFANQSHLTRQFRKVLHTTPGAYRRAVASPDEPTADGRTE